MKKVLILLVIGIASISCSSDDNNESVNNCDFETLISATQYANAPADPLDVIGLSIDNSCLRINFGASGCDGDTWELLLIDSGDILESDPPQRNVRLSLRNEELCEAYFTRELTFDISNLEVDGNRVRLNIINSDESILYEY